MIEMPLSSSVGTAPCEALERRNCNVAQWFQQWSAPMQRWVGRHSFLSSADLDDLSQEAFLRLLRYSGDTSIEHPQTYLFRIASNVASEWHERARRRRPHEDIELEELPIEAHEQPENIVARTVMNNRVREAVERLPQRQREVLLLHATEEMTYTQIAERLGLTRRIVRRDLTRAYAQLRWDLTPNDSNE